jgi:hypothetical protein
MTELGRIARARRGARRTLIAMAQHPDTMGAAMQIWRPRCKGAAHGDSLLVRSVLANFLGRR